ncbi:MAG: hypothetical protein H6711_19820 [Myxococcales bacterium]|nr:hypothetical protein [Myxococcales bacterium]
MLALRDLQPSPTTPPALVAEPFEAWCEAASQSPEAALAAVAGRLRFAPTPAESGAPRGPGDRRGPTRSTPPSSSPAA